LTIITKVKGKFLEQCIEMNMRKYLQGRKVARSC